MKVSIVLFLLFHSPTILFAYEGSVVFSNSGGQPITICDETGVYRVPIGSTYKAALYYAGDGVTDESQFLQIGGSANFGPTPGYFSGGGRTVPVQPCGGFAMFQVRAWEAAHGATYEEAFNSGIAKLGKSNIFRVDTANPIYADAPTGLVASGLLGFQISSPTCVPEPHLTLWLLSIPPLLFALRFSAQRQRLRS
jgi:hypothetical protein